MFRKKFRVRVKYFAEDLYVVQFTNHRFIPQYQSLCFWFEQSLTNNTETWSELLMDNISAENLAKTIKSIDDVKRFYEKDEAKEKDFYKRKKEHYNKNVPYRIKYF